MSGDANDKEYDQMEDAQVGGGARGVQVVPRRAAHVADRAALAGRGGRRDRGAAGAELDHRAHLVALGLRCPRHRGARLVRGYVPPCLLTRSGGVFRGRVAGRWSVEAGVEAGDFGGK